MQKPYLSDYSLLTVWDFWQVHYQILLIILLMEFINLNVNTNTVIKNVKHGELNTMTAIFVLNTQTLRKFNTMQTFILQ